ncbi:hypothetical protein CROQUDRAFT_719820 [Cronartium quercuum f. sp. fusiforme G11]|uniref:Arrestin-like N-terminal domain-containing protein n=1 Tax=Cronartium quercuum f. sp. fusiforme G11 TaxID=708437 RepID=A0A9P6TG30_9BASI|nr:hypothetical protein CROQUDRAFT_719820 [Cronartium quercuum f. sp. fusiforme G11]
MTETNTLRFASPHPLFLPLTSPPPPPPPPPTLESDPPTTSNTRRRGSLPSPSKASLGLSKLLSPVTIAVAIDNPLIFLHPRRIHPLGDIINHNPILTSSSSSSSSGPSPSPSIRLPQNRSHSPITPLHSPPISSDRGTDTPPSPSFPLPNTPPHFYRLSQTPDILDHNSNTILSGTFELKLLRPKELKKIIISLWGQSYIGFNDRPYEHQTILSNDVEIDLGSQLYLSNQHPEPGKVHYNSSHKTYLLDKGHYRFNWSFILPSNLPPYERGQFGRTIHKVIGKVKFSSSVGLGLAHLGKNLSSILNVGVNGVGQELETESYFVAVCNPASDDGEANGELALNFNVTDVSEHLGPYTLTASSAYFTVAGLLHFKLRLNQIPISRKVIKIYKITALVKQQYKLVSIKDKDPKTGERAESWPPCQRRKIFVLDHWNVGECEQDWHPCWSDEEESSRPTSQPASTRESEGSPTRPIESITPVQPTFRSVQGTRQASGSRSTSNSRSRSRIRDLIMTRPPNSPRQSSREDQSGTHQHGGWGASLSHLIGTSNNHHQINRTLDSSTTTTTSRARSQSRRPQLNESSNSSNFEIDTHKKVRGRSSQIKPRIIRSAESVSLISEREVPLVTITEDHSAWEIQHIGRLPNDDSIRPSTHPGTQTNIHIFHTLLFEISYSVEDAAGKGPVGEPTKRVLSIGKPVNVVSCCCMLESMVLPPYSKSDPNADEAVGTHPTPHAAARMFKCVCGMTTEKLLETQNPDALNEPIRFEINHNRRRNGHQNHDEDDLLKLTTKSTLEFRSLPFSSSIG